MGNKVRKKIYLKAYAKINLFLEIESKRKDGFHNIQSLFARVSLYDKIIISRGNKGINIKIKDNSNLGDIPIEKNIVYKTCTAFFKTFNLNPDVDIFLEKNIPVGAGLGGGSSDCACVLNGLSYIYKVNNSKKIFNIAKILGSDVPFFLYNYPFAHCYGRGEKVEKINLNSKMPNILIIWPDTFISTKSVYENFKIGDKSEIRKNISKMKDFINVLKSKNNHIDLSKFLFNRFEYYVFKKYPILNKVKTIIDKHSLPSIMSGSGSSLIAFSYDIKKLKSLYSEISTLHKFIFLAKFI